MSSAKRVDFGILLHQAYASFKAGMQAHMRAAGYDDLGSSFGYVFRFLEPEPRNLSQVAEALEMTPQGALKIVDDMVAKGYLAREAYPNDRRVTLLRLTRRATAALSEARRFHHSFEQGLARRMGVRRAASLRAMLEELSADEGVDSTPLRPL